MDSSLVPLSHPLLHVKLDLGKNGGQVAGSHSGYEIICDSGRSRALDEARNLVIQNPVILLGARLAHEGDLMNGRPGQQRTAPGVGFATTEATTGPQCCGQAARLSRFCGLKALFAQVAAPLNAACDLSGVQGGRSFVTDFAKHPVC
jgi:hypothetical protein